MIDFNVKKAFLFVTLYNLYGGIGQNHAASEEKTIKIIKNGICLFVKRETGCILL
jgi:hypothetical protein